MLIGPFSPNILSGHFGPEIGSRTFIPLLEALDINLNLGRAEIKSWNLKILAKIFYDFGFFLAKFGHVYWHAPTPLMRGTQKRVNTKCSQNLLKLVIQSLFKPDLFESFTCGNKDCMPHISRYFLFLLQAFPSISDKQRKTKSNKAYFAKLKVYI